jgi:UrcA family protein
MRARTITRAACATAALTAAAAVSAPAHAQYVDEVVVTGPVSRDGPSRLSQRVSYADLDLATYAGQEVLRLRIRDTARGLCRALGEDRSTWSPLVPSCESQAIRDARGQVRYATRVALARAEGRSYYAYAEPLR